jgi:hypothetical protein
MFHGRVPRPRTDRNVGCPFLQPRQVGKSASGPAATLQTAAARAARPASLGLLRRKGRPPPVTAVTPTVCRARARRSHGPACPRARKTTVSACSSIARQEGFLYISRLSHSLAALCGAAARGDSLEEWPRATGGPHAGHRNVVTSWTEPRVRTEQAGRRRPFFSPAARQVSTSLPTTTRFSPTHFTLPTSSPYSPE